MTLFHKGQPRRAVRASAWFAISAAVIAAVLLVNVLFTALSEAGLWFIDMTTYTKKTSRTGTDGKEIITRTDYEMYTLSDGCVELLDNAFATLRAERQGEGEQPVHVDLIFCEDPDNLMANTSQRYVYMTARCLEKAFPDVVSVSTIDIYKNPSAVQKYKNNSFSTVYSTDVIVASGSEYRRVRLNDFFTFDDDNSTTPWAYSGEKRFASSILAVTKAESPVCCLLTNHGERGYTDTLKSLLRDAGYKIVENFNLETDEIPEDCRLMISVAPKKDFLGYPEITAGTATVSEIARLDAFLDDENSFMVFFDVDTPVLPNFEEYMEKWGVSVCRVFDAAGDAQNYLLRDPVTSLSDDGQTLIADYVTTGLGASITADMRSLTYPSKVIFRNTTALTYPRFYKKAFVPADEETGTPEYTYATYSVDGVYRQVFDLFHANGNTEAAVGDNTLTREEGADAFKLMTIAKETSTEPGDRNGYTTVSHTSYVLACASTDFLCDELLMSNSYGNTDMLSSVLRTLGADAMAARIDQYIKPFHTNDVDDTVVTVASSRKTGWTAVLMILPAVLFFGSGAFVLIRRKYA